MSESLGLRFSYPDIEGRQVEHEISPGNAVFLLGANGTGKSALIQALCVQNGDKAKRIAAHRQTWFPSNVSDLTPARKKQVEYQRFSHAQSQQARWTDNIGVGQAQTVIYDLINSENIRAREIADAIDAGDPEAATTYAKENPRPLDILNELMSIAELPITISIEEDDRIVAQKQGSQPYSIAELSDGERNALLIAAEILTSDGGTLFLIDEPERHLHRAITSPLLTALFVRRADCAFVVATHDVTLAVDHPHASVLVLRSCDWSGHQAIRWDADLLPPGEEIDPLVKRRILGAKRRVLFVEGVESSLDNQIYEILFPDISVRPLGSCDEVIQAVRGIGQAKSAHWVEASGLVDADCRDETELDRLRTENIYALPCYSVEALYYGSFMLEEVAAACSGMTGRDPAELVVHAKEALLAEVDSHKERLCARVCERILPRVLSVPTWRDVQEKKYFKTEIDLGVFLKREIDRFESLHRDGDFDGILRRYPIRETAALGRIARSVGCQTRSQYEECVRHALRKEESKRMRLASTLTELSERLAEG